jgi:transposase
MKDLKEKNTQINRTMYEPEFKEQVLEIWNSGIYKTVTECARSYGIKESTLHTWISKSKQPIEANKDPEYVKLKKEHIKLKMELEILKKAAIYFASNAR